ncbi:MAG: hypothetical protein AB7F65_06690 [Dehalococcoidia bacterium]
MTELPRVIVVEALEPEDAATRAELDRVSQLAGALPRVLVDAAMQEIPRTQTTVADVGALVALICPRGGGPVHVLPLVVSHAVDHLRLETVFNGIDYVFPLTWAALKAAPMASGWEIRARATPNPTPRLEASTPYLLFESQALGFLIAIHPAAIRLLVLGLTRLVGAR